MTIVNGIFSLGTTLMKQITSFGKLLQFGFPPPLTKKCFKKILHFSTPAMFSKILQFFTHDNVFFLKILQFFNPDNSERLDSRNTSTHCTRRALKGFFFHLSIKLSSYILILIYQFFTINSSN